MDGDLSRLEQLARSTFSADLHESRFRCVEVARSPPRPSDRRIFYTPRRSRREPRTGGDGWGQKGSAAIVVLLAERLGIDTSSITGVSGHCSSAKIVAVDAMHDEAIRAAPPGEKPERTGGARTRE